MILEPIVSLLEFVLRLVALIVAIPVYIVAWVIGLPFALLLHGRLPASPLPFLGNMVARLF
jgi:hypothetical protein